MYLLKTHKITSYHQLYTTLMLIGLLMTTRLCTLAQTNGKQPPPPINTANIAYILYQVRAQKELLSQLSWRSNIYRKTVYNIDYYGLKLGGLSNINHPNWQGSKNAGKLYMSEQISTYYQKNKDKYHEIINYYTQYGYNTTPLHSSSQQQIIDIYQDYIYLPILSKRPFVSPLADDALQFYDFVYEGSYENAQGRILHNIMLIPKTTHHPLFSGIITINEHNWQVQACELIIASSVATRHVNILNINQEFTDTLHTTNNYLVNQTVKFTAKVKTHQLSGTITHYYYDYNTRPTWTKKRSRSLFSNKKLTIDTTTATFKHNAEWWQQQRPLVLQKEEEVFLAKHWKSPLQEAAFNDSLRIKQNIPDVGGLLFAGYEHHSEQKHINKISPLFDLFQFNTVEGARIYLKYWHSRPLSENERIEAEVHLRYGLSNRRINPYFSTKFIINQPQALSVGMGFGSKVEQIDNNWPISESANSLLSLFYKFNYMKIYERRFIEINAHYQPFPGLQIGATASFNDRLPLQNTSDFSLHTRTDRSYTLNNIPIGFTQHQAVVLEVRASYTPKQAYHQLNDRQQLLDSRLPNFTARYKQGIPRVFSSDIQYQQLELGVQQPIPMGVFGSSKCLLIFGMFFNKGRMEVLDFYFFNNNRSFRPTNILASFQQPTYFRYVTNNNYVQAQYEHKFQGFLLNQVPKFRQLKLHSLCGINGFYVNEAQFYTEAYIGLENIFNILRVDFVQSLTGFDNRGFRAVVDMNR